MGLRAAPPRPAPSAPSPPGEEYEPDARLLEAATSLGANDSSSLYKLDAETLYADVTAFMRCCRLDGI